MYDVKLQCPFSAIISGANQSGKTTFLFNLLQSMDYVFSQKPVKVFLFYKKHQEMYNQMLKLGLVDEIIELDEGMISEKDFEKKVSPYRNKGGSLCIFDDLMEHIDETNSKIFTKIVHHENSNVILLTQSLFLDNKHYRVMSKNATYIIVMKSPRDGSQLKHLAIQMNMNSNMLMEVFKEATKKPYSYLLIDFHAQTPDHIRLRSNIYPHERPMTTYMEKNCI